MTLKVNEIFYSIQGESTRAGEPCVFIRLTGCNLRCSYCDTVYAYDEGTGMEIGDILEKLKNINCRLVEITGGEPLLQKETPQLALMLLNDGYNVMLETNGSMDIGIVDDRCSKIMDVKCPSSGEDKNNDLENLKRLTRGDELKFIIADRKDYDFAKSILPLVPDNLKNQIPMHFSPCFGKIELEELAGWIIKDSLDVRLHLQLHKIIWPPDMRGV